ncbi:hypothetical protein D8674_017780 [Pyrus ussuriensis x Pyrus communis]|uniref:Uncharacterized protein n=1 Tax=Pyrus ussuriensis x Pyrus communis TaxID=2448454 RepID=A0A5N5HKQ4_9ROSA|nr:hypothetical protein D8674_017780 [Pyrus ussuriensis x Pyrus communis]
MLSLKDNSYSSQPNHFTSIEIPPKSSCNDRAVPIQNVNSGTNGVFAINQISEDVMEICLFLKDFRKSLLAKEPARLANLKTRVEDLEDDVS